MLPCWLTTLHWSPLRHSFGYCSYGLVHDTAQDHERGRSEARLTCAGSLSSGLRYHGTTAPTQRISSDRNRAGVHIESQRCRNQLKRCCSIQAIAAASSAWFCFHAVRGLLPSSTFLSQSGKQTVNQPMALPCTAHSLLSLLPLSSPGG